MFFFVLFFLGKVPASSSKVQVIPKSVYLLVEPDLDADEEYGLVDNMIVLKGQCDFSTEYSEEEVRSELVSLFKTKLPLITNRDFDFVRREQNTISVPVVKENHKWDFKHVKHLCGTGRLYVRLNVSQDTLIASDDERNDETEEYDKQPKFQSHTSASMEAGVSGEADSNRSSSQMPNESSNPTPIDDSDDGLAYLSSIFTRESRETLRESLMQYQNIELAAEALSEKIVRKETHDEDVHQILNRLKLSMKSYMYSEKLKVDREDLVIDVFHFYKSQHFDPTIPVRVQMKGEPAVDTGGVLRQVFTDVFADLASGSSTCLRLFRGQDARLTPIYSSEHVLTGVFEVLGKMIAHSLIQGGPGFPFLAPGIYWYIATGDLSEAVGRSSFVDIGDHELAVFIERVSLMYFFGLINDASYFLYKVQGFEVGNFIAEVGS